MDSGRSSQLWLLALLVFSSLAQVSPLEVMSAPSVLGVGRDENIFVECLDCTEQEISVTVNVWSFPSKDKMLNTTSVVLTQAQGFQGFAIINIPPNSFKRDPNLKQYVYLEAEFPRAVVQKVILVSFHAGYMFIQTDKTIYTPSSTVLYRIFGLESNMEPVKTIPTTIDLEIMTADGIVIPKGRVVLMSGMYSGTHNLGEIVSPGLWKVVGKFASHPQESFSAEFEVREYVLPSFEVKLTTDRPFFLVNDENLNITIKATYLFGENVAGEAYVVFGIVDDEKKRGLPGSLQRVQVRQGVAVATLTRGHIIQTFPEIVDLVGGSIYVAVNLLTDGASEMVEAELGGIQIVQTPYTINFKLTPKYFIPEMAFDVLVQVENPDGTPANQVDLMVTANSNTEKGRTQANGIARLSINTGNEPLTITAVVPDFSQSEATMTAHPYTSRNKNYIHISLASGDVKIGINLGLKITLSRYENAKSHITMLIMSRGQLLKKSHHEPRRLTAVNEIIVKEMMPSIRIIVYYFTMDDEMVADSVWVDVEDTCTGPLKLEQARPSASYKPRKTFNLKIVGEPGATVGLVAVDKGVYVLNNNHRLTQKKIWDLVEKHDTGCTPGGGSDGVNVFYDAGLIFKSNLEYDTPHRRDLKCGPPSRRKRARTILNVQTSLVNEYEDKTARGCCLEGMMNTPLSYTCKRRSEYIQEGPECVKAFLHCCTEMEKEQAEMRQDKLLLARSAERDASGLYRNKIVVRSNFLESWAWTNVVIPACRENECEIVRGMALLDSITTWRFSAISLSRTHGICVADPLDIIVKKDFFIDLKLPYSAVRGEQLEIKAVLHNYTPEPITVQLDLIEKDTVCSSASRRQRFRQSINVQSQSQETVSFIIIPMKEGKVPIEVQGFTTDGSNDGVLKHLLVVPEGVLKKSLITKTLNPAKEGEDGRQVVVLNNDIDEKDLVSSSLSWTHVSVTGREQLGSLVENAISGKSMGSLIIQPGGCGEQNMITMTLPVIATTYLDKTEQWEVVGFDKREEALLHISTGYNNELGFMKTDGSFSVFRDHPSSTWLTAYVVKVFAMARKLVDVKKQHICDAVRFLMTQTQKENGMFEEVGNIIHGEMIGDVRGTDSEASLTAFCVIALQESLSICNGTLSNLGDGITKAVNYLKLKLPNLTNPYAVAMTSYALANQNQLDRNILLRFISQDLTHWPASDSRLFTLEATAYALLALVKAKAFENARPVVRWFNNQQIDGGGYGSTQATIIVYQAIAAYWIDANEEDYNVNVDVVFPGRAADNANFNFNKESHYYTRTTKAAKLNQDVTVVATGSGEATVKLLALYYGRPDVQDSDCRKFDLSVQLNEVSQSEKIYKLIIKVQYKDKHRDATMSILDIGLLTGFLVNTDDLNSLSTGYARTISRYEMNSALSARGSLIIYLAKVSHNQSDEIAFRISQETKGAVLQPAAVSVYEYYDHQHTIENRCVKFYRPDRKHGELLRLCDGTQCTCAEENCSMQNKEKILDSVRTAKICESNRTSKIDFAYKVAVENITEALYNDIYEMRILQVIKEGSADSCAPKPGSIQKTCDTSPLRQLRPFLSYPHCKRTLDLKIGKTYLVMGLSIDIHLNKKKKSYQYMLGERTWIEYWPTSTECKTAPHRPTCLGIDAMATQFTIFGCQSK